ncbi:putative exported protein of unknown function [Methylobacterium sp. 4-46]|uniref:hypothetical protein n=1 Tax=unclassified Methylobacterium TaxID=2615210 RepID=UPI000152E14E|nr:MULTISPECIES: hypothetical protein [Methylobacterium]ACA20490.1 putative exported protein of unknown function [Methylobacterium sp. 4-46]WFT79656.1 hypothetical protein QA634_31435 [Methylobacterium nodulans]
MLIKSAVIALALGAGLVSAGLVSALPAVSGEARGYNGTWAVQLVTESGMCDARTSVSLAVRDGDVRLASASEGASVSGRIGEDGSVGLTVRKGPASGAASGRLQATSGSGTWTVSSLCTGRWTARRTTRVAQAE